MEIFGFAIMLLSIVIAWQTWRNGQLIKDVLRTIQEQGEQRHREVLDLLRTINEQGERRHQEVMDLLTRMDERTAKISELIEKIPERTKMS